MTPFRTLDFLNSWRTAFERNPVIDIFGATIIPLFDVAIPQWMAERKPRFEELNSRRKDVPAGPINTDYIFSPSMAIRRRVFERGIHFNENFGPQAGRKTYAMGSETAFCRATAGCQLQLSARRSFRTLCELTRSKTNTSPDEPGE